MSEVTENLVLVGEGKTKRPQSQMVVLGIMAGALIAAGAMASSVAMHAISNAGLARLTAGLVFPIGFVLMVLFGGELFTGDCLMVIGGAEAQVPGDPYDQRALLGLCVESPWWHSLCRTRCPQRAVRNRKWCSRSVYH